MIGTTEASRLLKICVQRVRELIYEGRIIGAEKVGRFWKIPLFNGMPKITEGTRGPKGTWRKRISTALTKIHVNQQAIRSNQKNGTKEPTVMVKSGSKNIRAHNVQINGSCEVVYRPENPLSCGAKVWIEVEPNVVVETFTFADMTSG